MLVQRFLLLAVVGTAPLAHAQFGVYADFTAQRLSGLQSSPSATAGVAYNSSVNPTGGTFGAFYDVKTVGPVRLGVDARFVHTNDSRGAEAASVGAGTRLYSTLGGVRASFHTPVKLLAPYVQGSAGLARSNFGFVGSQLKNSLEYHFFAGVDYNLLPVVSWRVIELGYGGLDAGGHNYPIANISTGIVLRFGGN